MPCGNFTCCRNMQLGKRDILQPHPPEVTTNTDVYSLGFLFCAYTWIYKNGIVLCTVCGFACPTLNTRCWSWAGHSALLSAPVKRSYYLPWSGCGNQKSQQGKCPAWRLPTGHSGQFPALSHPLPPTPSQAPPLGASGPHLWQQHSSPCGCPLVQQATMLAGHRGHEVPGRWAEEPVCASPC